MTHKKRNNKERLTVSLSSEATRYIKDWRLEHKAASVSAAFEDIIRDLQRKTELEQLNAQTIAYYDSLSPDSLVETAAWGEVGVEGLASVWENENPQAVKAEEVLAISR